MRNITIAVLCVLCMNALNAQKKDFGSWTVLNSRLTLAPRFELFNEAQIRSHSFYDNFFYYEVKGGVSFFLNKNFSFLAGAGKYVSYKDHGDFTKPVTANEFRVWQQLTMNNYLTRLKFEHRYRIEQRFYADGSYKNRFRYRLNAALPLNGEKIENGVYYISSFNEVFLTNVEPYFERNRFFIGGGYQFSDFIGILAGYIYQYDFKKDAELSKNFFQLNFIMDLDGKKSPTDRERIPGTFD